MKHGDNHVKGGIMGVLNTDGIHMIEYWWNIKWQQAYDLQGADEAEAEEDGSWRMIYWRVNGDGQRRTTYTGSKDAQDTLKCVVVAILTHGLKTNIWLFKKLYCILISPANLLHQPCWLHHVAHMSFPLISMYTGPTCIKVTTQ